MEHFNKENHMPKGTEHQKNIKKKAKFSLKEKRLRKREKKQREHENVQDVRDVYPE
jgi:hypothetical protein